MKAFTLCLCGLLSAGSVAARPLVIESRKELPFRSAAIASDGDWLIAMRQSPLPGDPSYSITSADLYRRDDSGKWTLDHTLATEHDRATNSQLAVAMSATVAAIRMPSGLHVYELGAAGWADRPLDVGPRRPRGTFLDIRGSTILATDEVVCSPEGLIINRRDNGHWEITARLPVPDEGCITGLALDVREAIILSEFDDPSLRDQAQIFERGAGTWSEAARFESPESDLGRLAGRFGPATALRGDLALVAGSDYGTHVYRRDANGWRDDGIFPNPDSYDFGLRLAEDLVVTDDYVIQVANNVNRGAYVGYVYRNAPGFPHVANLATDDSTGVLRLAAWRNRVIGQQGDRQIEFELPASFAVKPLVQQDFESGAAPEWTPLPGNRFAIVKSDRTFVYRQLDATGTRGALHSAINVNQSVSADIAPRVFNGADAWVGLVTRYVDEDNFYFATLRNDPDRVVLLSRVRGVDRVLSESPLDVAAGQRYRLGLESSGSHQAVTVDGRRVISTWDGRIFRGRAGVRLSRATADFDNLVVSPGPVANLVNYDVDSQGGVWSDDFSRSFQTLIGEEGRVLTGETRVDEAVQVLVTIRGYGTGAEPAFGLVVRHADPANYWYAAVRNTNKLYLRKVVNGVVTQIGGVNLDASPGRSFVLRLEAVGSRVRVYVDDLLRLETSDPAPRAGRVGAFGHEADALLAAYTAYEP
ncbi:MAG TPA: hypothetical protein VMF52_17610 [Steroidobacteraceae bacterium]|nr:hypothetical protein [Steroidobacteraceae bacterium]